MIFCKIVSQLLIKIINIIIWHLKVELLKWLEHHNLYREVIDLTFKRTIWYLKGSLTRYAQELTKFLLRNFRLNTFVKEIVHQKAPKLFTFVSKGPWTIFCFKEPLNYVFLVSRGP